MKKLLLTMSLICLLTIWCSVSMAQQTYQWGNPQTIQTPVVLGPQVPVVAQNFPNVRPVTQRSTVRHRGVHPASVPMPSIRKVSFPACQFPAPTPLVPLLVTSQTFLTVDSRVLWQRVGLNFHGDGLSLQNTGAVGEFGISYVNPKVYKVRYAFTMAQSASETPAVTTALQVGAAQLVQAASVGGAAAPVAGAIVVGVPVKIDYQWGPTHQITAVAINNSTAPQNVWANPVVMGTWQSLNLTGVTTIPPVISSTELFERFFWGVGGEFLYQQSNSRISVLAVGSDRFLQADTSLAYSVNYNLDLSVGWKASRILADKDTTIRTSALTAGLLFRF
jgi:hypothetical protein